MVCRLNCWGHTLFILGFSLLAIVPRAQAADIGWRLPAGGTFSSTSSWFGGVVPGASDVATFGLSTPGPLGALPPYTVSFTAAATNQGLRVSDDRVTFDLNGHVYTTTASVPMQLGTLSGASGALGVLDGIVILPFQSDLQIATTSGGSGLLAVAAGGLVIGSPDVIVGLNGNGTLNIFDNGDLIADQVTIGANSGSTGTATITGGGSSLLADNLVVGSSGIGTLNVSAGGRVDSTFGHVSSPFDATATVSDAGSKWMVSGQLSVGNVARGILSITNGGIVQDESGLIGHNNSPAQFGFVEVKDANSKWTHQEDLLVGHGGNGTVSITNGGLVENLAPDAIVRVGELGGLGTVDIDGVNSRWINASDLKVGTLSILENIVNVTGGGFMQCADAILGEFISPNFEWDRGTVIVSDPGSQWVASSIVVGDNGSGTLKVLAGGRVDVASNMSIGGGNSGGVGEVLVDGPASALIVDGELAVGRNVANTQTITITGGGVVQCASATMTSGLGGSVVVSGAGSTWDIADDLIGAPLGGATVRIQIGGTVNVGDAISLQDDDELHLEGGALRARTIEFLGVQEPFFWGAGRLSVDEIQIDTLIYNSGNVLAPGRELGETFIDGDLIAEPGGVTEIQIGGTTPGVTFDRVRVTGSITITNGTLEVSMLNGFVPTATDAFTVMSSLSNVFSGSFANIPSGQRLTTSDGVGSFLVSYGPGSPQVVLSAFQPGIPGDFDFDGDVDGRDFLAWQRGESPTPFSAGDLAAWQAGYNGGLLTASVAVPEPGAGFVLISGLTLLFVARYAAR